VLPTKYFDELTPYIFNRKFLKVFKNLDPLKQKLQHETACKKQITIRLTKNMGVKKKSVKNSRVKPSYKNLIVSLIDLMYYLRYLDPDTQKYRKEFTTKTNESVTFRPLSPKDDRKVLEFYNGLSGDTIYFRFFSHKKTVNLRLVRKYTRIDYEKQLVIVAEREDEIIGIGHLMLADEQSAEMAVIIADRWQHKGVGTQMLHFLVDIARDKGIHHLYGTVLRNNVRILKTIEKLGFKTRKRFDRGDLEVEAYI